MKNILLIVIILHTGFIVKAQSNNAPKLLYGESINSDTTSNIKQKSIIATHDSLPTVIQSKNKTHNHEPKLNKTSIINNENDSILIKKKEKKIEN